MSKWECIYNMDWHNDGDTPQANEETLGTCEITSDLHHAYCCGIMCNLWEEASDDE